MVATCLPIRLLHHYLGLYPGGCRGRILRCQRKPSRDLGNLL